MQRIPPFKMLDAVRGFAAIWVVMVHSCDRFLGTEGNAIYYQVPIYAFAIHGQLGVALFFVVSGYCIVAAAHSALYSGKTLGRYAFERCRRIFPPYWVALIFGVLATLLLHMAESHHWIARINHPQVLLQPPIYWFANLTLTQAEWNTGYENIVFWSLCYEVVFYVIVGICLFAAQRVAKARGMAAGQLTLILGLAFTTFATLCVLIGFGKAAFPFDLWHQFAFGGLLFYLIESNSATVAGYSARLRWILNGIAAVTIVLAVLLLVLPTAGGFPSKVSTLVCLLFCLFLAAVRPYDGQIAQSRWMFPLLWVGAFSYSLYLIHPVILPFIDVPCRKLGLDGNRYWITFWIQVAVAIAFGKLFYMLVERHFVSSRQKKRLVDEHVVYT